MNNPQGKKSSKDSKLSFILIIQRTSGKGREKPTLKRATPFSTQTYDTSWVVTQHLWFLLHRGEGEGLGLAETRSPSLGACGCYNDALVFLARAMRERRHNSLLSFWPCKSSQSWNGRKGWLFLMCFSLYEFAMAAVTRYHRRELRQGRCEALPFWRWEA